ncbi:MAG: hypothetical protein HY864_03775 [Chloroflexi bacterium]|nr:hypothetical protein [Chloroflexota bacterium]
MEQQLVIFDISRKSYGIKPDLKHGLSTIAARFALEALVTTHQTQKLS